MQIAHTVFNFLVTIVKRSRKIQVKFTFITYFCNQYIQNAIISIFNQYKNYQGILRSFFHINSSDSSIYFTLTAHLNLNYSYFKCSIAICSSWLLYWTMQVCNTILDNLICYHKLPNLCFKHRHFFSAPNSHKGWPNKHVIQTPGIFKTLM